MRACVRATGSYASQAFSVTTAGDYTSFPNVCLSVPAIDLCLHLSLLLWLLSSI